MPVLEALLAPGMICPVAALMASPAVEENVPPAVPLNVGDWTPMVVQ